jgi:DNA-binding NarL/FixJ family response regulator
MPIRILIVDDSHIMRTGLRAALAKQGGFEVVGEAADGDEVLASVEALQPDLVIMDIEMRRVGGIEATRQLSEVFPAGPKILMTSLYADDHLIAEGLRAGAMGYVLKTCIIQDLVPAIRRLVDGGQFVSRRVALLNGLGEGHLPRIAAELKRRLTPPELGLIDLLAARSGDRAVADRLEMPDEPFESLCDRLVMRLSLDSREQLSKFARAEQTVEA